MPTIRFVLEGGDEVVDADRVVRDSQLYVAERREAGQWQRVGAWPRDRVTAVLRQLDGPGSRWFPEDVRTSAGLQAAADSPREEASAAATPTTRTARQWLLRRPPARSTPWPVVGQTMPMAPGSEA